MSLTSALDLEINVWKNVGPNLAGACKAKERADPKDRKKLTGLTADYLVHVVKDTQRSTCETVARQICQKYPDTFNDIINGEIYGN